jgi:RNA polymerase sigma factor (sigma-70 family)
MPIGSPSSRADAASRLRSHLTIGWLARGAVCFAGFRGVVMDGIDAITEAALRASNGDAASARAFVRATQTDVWRLCAHLSTGSAADDLTQETYARAFSALHRFAGPSSARTWLLSIARRVCADAVRAAIRSRALAPVGEEMTERAATRGVRAHPGGRPVMCRGGRRVRLPGRHDPVTSGPGAPRKPCRGVQVRPVRGAGEGGHRVPAEARARRDGAGVRYVLAASVSGCASSVACCGGAQVGSRPARRQVQS